MNIPEMIDIVRLLLALVAGANTAWSFPSIIDLVRGRNFPIAPFQASVCALAFGTSYLQATHFFTSDSGLDSAWALAGFVALLTGHAGILVAQMFGFKSKIKRLYAATERPDLIIALSELAEIDPETAERIRREAITATVDKLMDGSVHEWGDRHD